MDTEKNKGNLEHKTDSSTEKRGTKITPKKLQSKIKWLYLSLILLFIGLCSLVYVITIDALSCFKQGKEVIIEKTSDPDSIENGIHLASGLVEAKGLLTVVQNCTSCHSGLLVSQNRMSREGWKATILWMQETQGLWDLGTNEVIILDYLSANYAPENKGRRGNLKEVEWYVLP